MDITAKYQKNKQNLLSTFDLLKEYKFIPVKVGEEQINEEEINKHKENLINEIFTISVCGQINAGKSTLLNYLLFKDEEILPSDDTPWTAKLTTMKYGKKNSANVTFYTEKEWNDLKNLTVKDETTGVETTYYEKFLEEEVDHSAENGIYDKEIIKENAFTKKISDLKNLREYVAKKGIYTPFVAHMELIVNNELLKNVVIVDTPGINDPNTQRSKVTEEWINKSNAVIYLFYAGAALDIADFEFIDNYLQFIPSEKIIFAINKADTNGEYLRAKSYVENSLKTNKDLKERNLLKNKEVYPISSLAALLTYKKNNTKLNENEQWDYDRLQKKANDFIENNGYIENLIKAIETNIMQGKGDDILKKAKQTINIVCKSKINEVKKNISENQVFIKNTDITVKELQSKINEIKQVRIEVNDIIRKYERRISQLSGTLKNKTTASITQIEDNIKKRYKRWLYSGNTDANKAIKLTGYTLSEIAKSEFVSKINSIIPQNSEIEISDLQDEYKQEIKKILNEDLRNLIDYFLVPTIDLKDILGTFDKYLQHLDLSGLKSTFFFIFTREEKTKDNVFPEVSQQIDKFTAAINSKILQVLENSVTSFLTDTKKGIINNINKYEKDLKDIQNSAQHKETVKNQKEQQIEILKNELVELELNYNKIKQNI